ANAVSTALRARIAEARTRLDEITNQMSQPDVLTDSRQLQTLGREQATLTPIVDAGNALERVEQQIEDNRLLRQENDPEMRELAEEEIRSLEERHDALMAEVKDQLRPRDPN